VITQLQNIVLKISVYYSNQEITDMHFMYNCVNENASAAQCQKNFLIEDSFS